MLKRFRSLPASYREAMPYLLLIAAVMAAYANIYSGAFLFEDQILIINNKFLRSWHYLPDIFTHTNYGGDNKVEVQGVFYRPITITMYLILYQLFGLSSAAFHAFHVLVHSINVCLVNKLGRKLGFTAGASFAAALIWGVHPLHTQDVSFMSSTGEIMWSMFALIGLNVLLPDFAPRKIAIAALCFVLAALCKEAVMVFPAVAVACLFVVSKDRLKPATYFKTWPFWLLSAALIFILLKHGNLHMGQAFIDDDVVAYNASIFVRIFTSLATLPAYFGLMIWPAALYFPHTYPVFHGVGSWQVVLGAAMVAGAVAQIIIGQGKRGIPLTFAFFWFAAVFSPFTGIIVPIDFVFSEGWMYMPTAGLALGVAQAVALHINSKKATLAAGVAVALVALSLGIKTHVQNEVYQDMGSFFKHGLDCGEDLAISHNNLGIYYLVHNRFDEAIAQFKAVEANPGIRTPGMTSGFYLNLATAYLRVPADENGMTTPEALVHALPQTHQIPEAVAALKESLRYEPNNAWARQFLDIVEAYQKQQADISAGAARYRIKK